MTKSTTWKLFFIIFLVLISFALITPFEDQELGEYALSQANSQADAIKHPGHENFSDVISKLRTLPGREGLPVDFMSLRNYGKQNQLDYAAYFQPPSGVIETISSRFFPFWIKPGIRAGHLKDRDERNELVLRSLLSNSQAAIKRGLDLRGGIAFTMEVSDLNESSTANDPSGTTAMDKVVEIMSERLNAFGVAETVVRKKGDRAIEIQIPDRTSKQNPGMIDELQKPAKLEFRIVNVNSGIQQPVSVDENMTDDQGIPFVSMMRNEAEPNESPKFSRHGAGERMLNFRMGKTVPMSYAGSRNF